MYINVIFILGSFCYFKLVMILSLYPEHKALKLFDSCFFLFFLQSKVALLPSESYTVGDLKGEILSLKGLLLNRWAEHKQVTGSVIMKYWIFYLWICYPFNSLHPDISIHFLQTLLYTFPLTPARRICITIKVS